MGLLVLVSGTALGVGVAGLPDTSEDAPLTTTTTRVPSTTTTTVAPVPVTQAAVAAVPPFPGPIGLGDDGPGVTLWQEQLVKRGLDVAIDGRYGAGVRDATREFQRAHGLPVTGVVDQRTWETGWTAP
jgi:peptidoglycan hydrolase-like protein with peptidoglycan-binding domain